MKKALSLALALVMAMAVAVPAFAVSTPAAVTVPASVSDTEEDDYGVMPLLNLFYLSNINQGGSLWPSPQFTATPGSGNYIRFWHKNDTDSAVTVYLCRYDTGERVSAPMSVPAHTDKSSVYYASDADSHTYKIEIEAPGQRVCGDVAAAQYSYIAN